MQVAVPPLLPLDQTPSRVTLRDGSTATLRVSSAGDHAAVARFFRDLSPESRRRRFFTLAPPSDALIDTFCDSSDPTRRLTLVAIRKVVGEPRPIAIGSYISLGNGIA